MKIVFKFKLWVVDKIFYRLKFCVISDVLYRCFQGFMNRWIIDWLYGIGWHANGAQFDRLIKDSGIEMFTGCCVDKALCAF